MGKIHFFVNFSVSHYLSNPAAFQPIQHLHLLSHDVVGLQTKGDNPSLIDHCIFSQSLHDDFQYGQAGHAAMHSDVGAVVSKCLNDAFFLKLFFWNFNCPI